MPGGHQQDPPPPISLCPKTSKIKVKRALHRLNSMWLYEQQQRQQQSITRPGTCRPHRQGHLLAAEPAASEYQVAEFSSSSSSSSSSLSRARKRSQFLALVPVYLLQFCYGLNTGFPAILTPQLREEEGTACSKIQIDGEQESWIVSLDNLATPLVCVVSGYLQQHFGPKKVLLAACLPYLLGWTLCAVASSVEALYLSRLLVGVSHALVTTTVYTVEVASKEMRGTYSLWESVVRCCGCLSIYTLGFFFRWDDIAVGAHAVPILAFVTCLFVPESPVYLLKRREVDKAERALKTLYGSRFKVFEEIELMKENMDHFESRRSRSPLATASEVTRGHGLGGPRSLRRHPEIWQPFLIVIMLSFVQQFSGVSVLRAYVVRIFDDVFQPHDPPPPPPPPFNNSTLSFNVSRAVCSNGDGDQTEGRMTRRTSSEAYVSAIAIALVRLVASLLLSNLLMRYKRRSLYFTSALLTVLSLCAFAASNALAASDGDHVVGDSGDLLHRSARWASLLTACFLVFSVQLGVQTLPQLLSGELFTSDVRALCKGFARGFTCAFLLVSLKTFPWLESSLGVSGTFLAFAAVTASSVPAVYLVLPETKDVPLEMVRHYFTEAKTVFYVGIEEDDDDEKAKIDAT